MATRPLAFIDTETTGLNPHKHEAWEIAVIHRRTNGTTREALFQIRTSITEADPKALEINRYKKRFAVPQGTIAAEFPTNGQSPIPLTERDLVLRLMDLLDDAVLVGSNPSFDERFLTKLFHDVGYAPGWHYRTIDVATLAAGYLHGSLDQKAGGDRSLFADDYPAPPYSSRDLSREVHVEPPGPDTAHTALGDARWAMNVYDAITGPSRV